MKHLEDYWVVALFADEPKQSTVKFFWDLAFFHKVLETKLETLEYTWRLTCRFERLEQANFVCEQWKSLKTKAAAGRAIKIYVGVWDSFHSSFIDVWEKAEKRIQTKLHQKLGGRMEVPTLVGKIDLLTETEVIEIKGFYNWKCGLGQLLAYSFFVGERKKRLYLFCRYFPSDLKLVEAVCQKYDVLVDFELDRGWKREQ